MGGGSATYWATIAVAVALLTLGSSFRSYRRRKRSAYLIEIELENIRLWRGHVQDYRDRHPNERPTVSIAEEAVYMSSNSKHRVAVRAQAVGNVKAMTKFGVQEYKNGAPVGRVQEVHADSPLEAGVKLITRNLREAGHQGELRARVFKLPRLGPEETALYADLPH